MQLEENFSQRRIRQFPIEVEQGASQSGEVGLPIKNLVIETQRERLTSIYDLSTL